MVHYILLKCFELVLRKHAECGHAPSLAFVGLCRSLVIVKRFDLFDSLESVEAWHLVVDQKSIGVSGLG